MAWKMDIVLRTMSHIIKGDLGCGALKQGESLTIALKENRIKKKQDTHCCCMVKSITKKSSLQMKKMFTVEETFNKQNNRVYARSSKKVCKLVPRNRSCLSDGLVGSGL